MREAMLDDRVAGRPKHAATLVGIQGIMNCQYIFEIGRRFLSDEQLSRKYGAERGMS